MGTIP